jgi:hypothetical protein
MEGDGVDSIDVVAVSVALKGEVFGLHVFFNMMHGDPPFD